MRGAGSWGSSFAGEMGFLSGGLLDGQQGLPALRSGAVGERKGGGDGIDDSDSGESFSS